MAIQNINQASIIKPTVASPAKSPGEAVQSFGSFLESALGEVNKQQLASDEATKRIASGDVQDLHQALIIKEQAGITLDLTIQVRNKAVEAYQEIMRMNM
jgi:flagellar hook-basal body complex protein FliE